MRRSLILITTAVSLSATVFVHAADDLVLSRFSDFLDALREQSGIPGLAATIVSTNDVMWEHANGLRDVERNLPVRTDTPKSSCSRSAVGIFEQSIFTSAPSARSPRM